MEAPQTRPRFSATNLSFQELREARKREEATAAAKLIERHLAPSHLALALVLLTVGTGALFFATLQLESAHLYQQRTNEGLGWASVAMFAVPGTLAFLCGAWLMIERVLALAEGTRRKTALLVAMLCTPGIVMIVGITYVSGLGDRCWGTCG